MAKVREAAWSGADAERVTYRLADVRGVSNQITVEPRAGYSRRFAAAPPRCAAAQCRNRCQPYPGRITWRHGDPERNGPFLC